MKWIILTLPILVFLIYCLLPGYWARNYSKKVIRKGPPNIKEIALTFDDGPNPQYTPELLDILSSYGIKASFFIMGKQAELYPDIIKRMAREGHTIGYHSYSHRHAWLMPPFTTIRDMNKVREIITRILNKTPNWYRPPWGAFNLFSIFIARKLGLNVAYWSIEARDWAKDTTVTHIYEKVVRNTKPGSIIVLHDNRGVAGAPERTLKALPQIIETLHGQGYKFVNLDNMKTTYFIKNEGY